MFALRSACTDFSFNEMKKNMLLKIYIYIYIYRTNIKWKMNFSS